jgi:DNA-binding response OmpR family regulator
MRLLVIEDDHLLRDNLVHHLLQRGFTVFAATVREEVGALLESERIEVALLGLGGLRRQGLGLLSLIKSESPDTAVILMTTPDLLQLSIEGMKLGAFDDIQVPYDIDLLCSKIKEAKKSDGTRKM